MRVLIALAFCLLAVSGFGQDSLLLNLRQTDSLFVRNNLLLLAERFRIEASRAQVVQAGLYDNPSISAEISAYNAGRRRVLDVGGQGQKIFSVQQLLYTAGKRNKRVALAQEVVRMTEYEFGDLLRALRFEVHSRFFTIYFQQQTLSRYDQQIATLQGTVNAFEQQYERNNVSLRELVRLRALLFELTNERLDVQLQLTEHQQALRTLLSADQPVSVQVDKQQLARYRLPLLSADSLRERALLHRSDLLASHSLSRQAELNYTFQRSLAVPDVRVGGTYDQAGSYIPNYLGLSVSVDLPFFNRNQGAIRAARSQIDYQQRLQQQKVIQVSNEVMAALKKIQEVDQTVQSVGSRFTEQFEQLSQGVFSNFQRRNLSLLEFIDFIETYNESLRKLNRLRADRVGAYEELNYVVGEELFN